MGIRFTLMDIKTTMIRPDKLIVGPPRSGTTWLRRQLLNNKIAAIPGNQLGELNFYGFRAFDYSRLEGINEIDEIVDFTPIYLTHQPSFEDILTHQKILEIKTLAIIRDPVERFVSDFFHKFSKHEQKDYRIFEATAIDKYLSDPQVIQSSTDWYSPGKLLSHSFWSANLKEIEKSSSHLTLPFKLMVHRPEIFMRHVTDHFRLPLCNELDTAPVNSSVRTLVSQPSDDLSALLRAERKIVDELDKLFDVV